jgi:hypothetical protein
VTSGRLLVEPAERSTRDGEGSGDPKGGTPLAKPLNPPKNAPRPDLVFIMGQDPGKDGFYHAAERFYRAHVPGATLVTNLRTLADVLTFISKQPGLLGDVYLVSHAAEDGTLAFNLDAADPTPHLRVQELRAALHPTTGASHLADVSAQIDEQTKIRIKGCDIGRTQEMVELIDEAFGGAGTVTAPTHEQDYGDDPKLADRARADFRAAIRAKHPEPPAVDPGLTGDDRRKALDERKAAVAQRTKDIAADLAAHATDEAAAVERARTIEAFAGPMFQHPGSKLFAKADIAPEVDRLYGHLSDKQRAGLVTRLVTVDRKATRLIEQQGQKAYRLTAFKFGFNDPQTKAEMIALNADAIRRAKFTPTTFKRTEVTDAAGTHAELELRGVVGRAKDERVLTLSTMAVPDDKTLIDQHQDVAPNPGRYDWKVERTHTGFATKVEVVGRRVVAYLHHGLLDVSKHEHFTRPETDPDFFATSTFKKPPVPPPKRKKP